MGQAVYTAPLTRVQGEQLSLSSTVASLGIPPGYHGARLYCPTSDFRFHINPAILGVFFYDTSATAGSKWIKTLTAALTDRDTSTGTGTTMNSAATGDRLYICTSDNVGGFRFTIGNANINASVLSAAYGKNDNTFATQTIGTDGTDSPAGTTLGASGAISWTAPTDALRQTLTDLAITDADIPILSGFWWRFAWSAAFDSTTSLTEIWTLNKDTSRAYWYGGTICPVSLDLRNDGAIEAIVTAGTPTLDVNWLRTLGV